MTEMEVIALALAIFLAPVGVMALLWWLDRTGLIKVPSWCDLSAEKKDRR